MGESSLWGNDLEQRLIFASPSIQILANQLCQRLKNSTQPIIWSWEGDISDALVEFCKVFYDYFCCQGLTCVHMQSWTHEDHSGPQIQACRRHLSHQPPEHSRSVNQKRGTLPCRVIHACANLMASLAVASMSGLLLVATLLSPKEPCPLPGLSLDGAH